MRQLFNRTIHNQKVWLVLLIVVSRIPLLFLGYGSDGDGWRVAWTASMIWDDGFYQPSRFPGFPVYELINVPLVGLGGSLLSNSATMIVFIIAVFIFQRLLSEWQVPNADVLTWTFAFFPILWKNSTVTMDYIWGMTLILMSMLLIVRKRYLVAGVVFGLAAGVRLTNIVYLIPVFFLMDVDSRWREFFRMAFIVVTVAVVCYIPVVLRAEFTREIDKYVADIRHHTLVQRFGFFIYRSGYAIGLLGSLSIVVVLMLTPHRSKVLWRVSDRRFLVSLSACVSGLAVFFLLPDEREYLIPIMPFVLVLLALVSNRTLVNVSAVCLLSYAFVNVDLIQHGFGKQRFAPNIARGMVVRDFSIRHQYIQTREIPRTFPWIDSSIVMTGWGPIFWFDNPYLVHTQELEEIFLDEDVAALRGNRQVYFVYKLTHPQVEKFGAEGYQLYYLKDAKEYLESFLEYDLDSAGVQPLDIPIPN